MHSKTFEHTVANVRSWAGSGHRCPDQSDGNKKSPAGTAGLFLRGSAAYFFADFFAGAFLVAFGVAFLAGADFVAGPPISMLSAVTPFFFSASENHTGRLPRPDQVCVGFSGLRYFGATVAFVPLAPWPPRLG
jgi:hypothetical protein